MLLVYRVDRLTRSLLDDLDRAGVTFRSATEPFDTVTAIGRMLVQMLGMFAQFERDRGHRTTTGGQWTAHQVLRVLANRVYLGELTCRGITPPAATPRSSSKPCSPERSRSWPPAARITPNEPRADRITCSPG